MYAATGRIDDSGSTFMLDFPIVTLPLHTALARAQPVEGLPACEHLLLVQTPVKWSWPALTCGILHQELSTTQELRRPKRTPKPKAEPKAKAAPAPADARPPEDTFAEEDDEDEGKPDLLEEMLEEMLDAADDAGKLDVDVADDDVADHDDVVRDDAADDVADDPAEDKPDPPHPPVDETDGVTPRVLRFANVVREAVRGNMTELHCQAEANMQHAEGFARDLARPISDETVSLVAFEDEVLFVRWVVASTWKARNIVLDPLHRIVSMPSYMTPLRDLTGCKLIVPHCPVRFMVAPKKHRIHMPAWCVLLMQHHAAQLFSGPVTAQQVVSASSLLAVAPQASCVACQAARAGDHALEPVLCDDLYVCQSCSQHWHGECASSWQWPIVFSPFICHICREK